MSTFSPAMPPLDAADDLPQPVRAAATDSYIKANRAATPAIATQQRGVPRYSIAELNAADPDEIRERFLHERFDNRGPVTRFLDLIDLPRNTVAGLLAPSIRRRKEAEGDTGTLGQGHVYFSDILDDLGVKNHVVRAVGGFVGDVLLDPITYAGPAGWGAKVASAGGKTAQLTKGYVRAAKAAQEAWGAGRDIADPLIREYVKHAAPKTAEELGQHLFGQVKSGILGKTDSFASRAARFGGDIEGSAGGLVTDALDEVIHPLTAPAQADRIRAAKAVVAHFGRDAAPGIRFGPAAGKLAVEAGVAPGAIRAGTGYLHIPFTDIGLYGPAITNNASMGIAYGNLARGVSSSGVIDPDLQAIHGLTGAVNGHVEHMQERVGQLNNIDRETEAIKAGTVSPVHPETGQVIDPAMRLSTLEQERAFHGASVSQILDDLRGPYDPVSKSFPGGILGEIRARTMALEAKPLAEPADIIFAQKLYRANEANARGLMADVGMSRAETGPYKKRWQELHDEFGSIVDQRVKKEAVDHAAAQVLAKAEHLNEVQAVREARNQAEADRVLRGESPHPVLTPDTEFPGPAPFEPGPAFDEVASRKRHAAAYHQEYLDKVRANAGDPEIFNTSEETLKANSNFADALHDKMEASVNLAAATQGPLDAALHARDRMVMDTAKAVLGLSPEDLGYPMFAPLRAITKSLSDDKDGTLAAIALGLNQKLAGADASMSVAFGRRSGKAYEQMRDYLRAKSPLMNQTTQEVLGNVSRDIDHLVNNPTHNLTGENRVELGVLVGAMIDAKDMPLVEGSNDVVFRIIKDAAEKGLFSEAAHPGLMAEARAVADKWYDQIRALGGIEVAQGRLGGLRDTYGLPSMLTRETAQRLAATKKYSAAYKGGAGAEGVAGKIAEFWQKPRSTDRLEWTTTAKNAAGEDVTTVHNFMEGERIYKNFDAEVLNRLEPEFANVVRKKQKTIDAYDAMKPSEQATVRRIPTSRFEVNRMAKDDGRFKWLTGGSIEGDFFETNAALAIANRFGSSRKNYLYNRLMDFATQYGRSMGENKIKNWQQLPNGHLFKMDNGANAALFKDKSGRPFLTIGDQRFRQLDKSALLDAKYDPTRAIVDNKDSFHSLWYPEQVADLIEGSNRAFKDDESISGVIKAVDEINKLWKSVTLFHPSWTIGDLFGSVILAVHAGANPANLVKHTRDAIRIVLARHKEDRETLGNVKLNILGREMTGLDIADHPHAGAIFGGNNAYEAAMQMLGNGQLVPASTYRLWKNPGKAVKEEWGRAEKFAEANAGAETWAKSNKSRKTYGTARAFVDDAVMRRVVSPWFQLNAIVNDVVRTAAHLSFMEQGYDAASSARRVSEHMFDMTTLTDTEQKLRKLIPFYSWQKNSGVYGMRMLMEDPKFFAVAPKLKRLLEEAANGDENVPEYQRPSWMRDQQAVQFGRDPDTRNVVLYQSMLPQEAATYFATGLGSPVLGAQSLQDALSYFANSLSPVIKAPLELASHREWFSKREISGDGTGDLTPTEYALGQVRPLKEFGVGNIRHGPVQKAFGIGPGHGLARLAVGGRLQPAGDERLKFQMQREFDAQVSSIHKRINLAEREGDHAESVNQRAMLLRVYEAAQKTGIKIPNYAGSELADLTQ